MLGDRYEKAGKTDDLDKAICQAQKAVDLTRSNMPQLAGYLLSLGNHLSSRYERTDEVKDREAAVNAYCKSSEWYNGNPLLRIHASRQAIQLLNKQNDLKKATEVAQGAVKLLPALCSRYLNRDDQQQAISHASGLAAGACSLLLETEDDADQALEFLEHGRGLILGYLVDSRSEFAGLKSEYPEIFIRFEDLKFKATTPIGTTRSLSTQEGPTEREKAEKDFENCLKDIRRLPKYDRFLLPPSVAYLKGCAAEGPIIVVNDTNISSDALIVLESGVEHINLPELTADKIKYQYCPYTFARGAARDAKVVGKQIDNYGFRSFLSWLWLSCVRLVLEKLGFYEKPTSTKLYRIWWVGTGLATSLPFHAAGDHSVDSIANTLCHAISSYTPTIKALGHTREKINSQRKRDSVLLIVMPETPGGERLPGVEREENAIREVIGVRYSVETLDRPNVENVLDTIGESGIVHFACHGSADLVDPSNSYLALQENSNSMPGKLTVSRLSDTNLGQAWLAYLSACSTAEARVSNLADEALHLSSSFQIAGFGHVAASMWPSNDDICVEMAKIFYRELMIEGNPAGNMAVAAALHAAVKEIRSRNHFGMLLAERPSLWVQYIHSGA
jgi:tetratricopeptide (TPR) repeat protein